MSGIKPVIRELREAVLDGMAHAKGRLHQVTDHLDDHFDTVARRVRDEDTIETVTTRGRNTKTTRWDSETGRPISERGRIDEDFGGSPRGDNATAIGNLGEATDDGGHLGAHRFFGDTPDEGIVPQASNLNRGAWRKMENEWSDWVAKGYRVHYTVDVSPAGAVRPDRFAIEYTVSSPTGEVAYRNFPMFKNVAGQTFDRVSAGDMPAL